MMSSRKAIVAFLAVVLVVGAAALYKFALPGFSSARPEPPKTEIAVATWLLRHSVPAEAKQATNPLYC